MSIVEHLEKVLGDLVANRGRLAEQINIQTQQTEVNQTQLEHFDTLIATVRNTLGDATSIARVEELLATPDEPKAANSPLDDAGAGAENAPAPAAPRGLGIPSQG